MFMIRGKMSAWRPIDTVPDDQPVLLLSEAGRYYVARWNRPCGWFENLYDPWPHAIGRPSDGKWVGWMPLPERHELPGKHGSGPLSSRGDDVEEVQKYDDGLVTYPTREDALEVLAIAKDIAEQTGIPLPAVIPKLEEMAARIGEALRNDPA